MAPLYARYVPAKSAKGIVKRQDVAAEPSPGVVATFEQVDQSQQDGRKKRKRSDEEEVERRTRKQQKKSRKTTSDPLTSIENLSRVAIDGEIGSPPTAEPPGSTDIKEKRKSTRSKKEKMQVNGGKSTGRVENSRVNEEAESTKHSSVMSKYQKAAQISSTLQTAQTGEESRSPESPKDLHGKLNL